MQKHLGTIAIEGIDVYAYHGVYRKERVQGHHFVVDVYLTTAFSQAAVEDKLADTVDYFAVYSEVLAIMETPVHLLETLTVQIGERILEQFPAVEAARVRVSKRHPMAMPKCQQTYTEMSFHR